MKIVKKIVLIIGVAIAFAVICSHPSKALTAVRVTTDDLNLRQKASTDSSVYTTLSTGDECTFIAEEGDWYKVEYGYYTGYLSKQYAKLVNYDENGDEENNQTDDNQSDNHQTEPSTVVQTGKMSKDDKVKILPLINSTVLQTLKKGTEITIITETNGWYYIATDTISAWVRQDSVKLDKQSSVTTNTTPQDDDKKDDNDQDDQQTDEPEDNNSRRKNKDVC